MLNKRREAVQQIHAQLQLIERAIDTAVAESATLAAYLPRARMNGNLAAEIGQAALDRTASAFNSLIEARREMVAAHQELNTVKDQVGLRTLALGGDDKRPTGHGLVIVEAAA